MTGGLDSCAKYNHIVRLSSLPNLALKLFAFTDVRVCATVPYSKWLLGVDSVEKARCNRRRKKRRNGG